MKIDSLWYDVADHRDGTATLTLTRCRNCGQVKVLSDPCGFDHLAATLEANAAAAGSGSNQPGEPK